MNVIPWEPYKSKTSYQSSSWRRLRTFTCKKTVEHVSDSHLQYWRKGDIVKFESGLEWRGENTTWEEWFLSDEDYLKFLKNSKYRNKRVPLYATRQYGLIIGKYRIIKEKWGMMFYDYGKYVLMLTGSRKGHYRKYYGFSPFTRVAVFPHKEVPDKLNEFSDIILSHKEDSEECRNKLVSEIYQKT